MRILHPRPKSTMSGVRGIEQLLRTRLFSSSNHVTGYRICPCCHSQTITQVSLATTWHPATVVSVIIKSHTDARPTMADP